MKTFAYSLQGEDIWDWYCSFKPKEIKSFLQLMKKFQRHWIYGYEEVEDACIFLDIQDKIGENINDLMMKYDDNPSSDLLVEIEERKNAYFFLGDSVEEKYGDPSLLK
jgi:hypothetical protein